MAIVLKFELDGEFRRARLEEKSWVAVVEAFERSFPELVFADVTLKYADDEGDMCLLSPSSFADFKALTEGAKNAKVEVVRSPMPGLVVAKEESNEPMETEPVQPANSAVDEGCLPSSASSCELSNKPPPAHNPELFDLYSDASSSSCSSDEDESAGRHGAADTPKDVTVAKEDFKAAKRAYKLARKEAQALRKASKAEFKAHKKECSLEKKACKALLKQEKQQLKEARRARKQSGCSSSCSSFAPPARLSAPPSAPPASTPPSASGKLLSFPVEVEDGRRLTISWRQGEPVFNVAKNFATENQIGDDELATIVEFIHIAERSVAREAAAAAEAAAMVDEPVIPAPSAPPAPDYQESVQQLADMGFIDVELNMRLLEELNGDLQAVTNRLLAL